MLSCSSQHHGVFMLASHEEKDSLYTQLVLRWDQERDMDSDNLAENYLIWSKKNSSKNGWRWFLAGMLLNLTVTSLIVGSMLFYVHVELQSVKVSKEHSYINIITCFWSWNQRRMNLQKWISSLLLASLKRHVNKGACCVNKKHRGKLLLFYDKCSGFFFIKAIPVKYLVHRHQWHDRDLNWHSAN